MISPSATTIEYGKKRIMLVKMLGDLIKPRKSTRTKRNTGECWQLFQNT